jgi:DNA-binding MarR family transcriptional regulator
MTTKDIENIDLSVDAWTGRPIAQLLGAIASVIRRSAARTYPPATGLTKAESEVLDAIDRQGSTAARDVSELTTLNEGQVSIIVKTLIARRLIRRTRDLSDSRRHLLALTPTGKARLKKVERHLKTRQQLILDGMTPAEQAQFFGLLLKVLTNAKRLLAHEEQAPVSREARKIAVTLP